MLVDTYASQTSHSSYPLSRIQGQRIGSVLPTRRIDCRRCPGPWRHRQCRAQVARRYSHETLCTHSQDMRAGADRLLSVVVNTLGKAQAHHGYLFANARASRIKLLVHDGFGVWCATR